MAAALSQNQTQSLLAQGRGCVTCVLLVLIFLPNNEDGSFPPLPCHLCDLLWMFKAFTCL